MKTLKNLFIEELSARYDSEKQQVKAMPTMLLSTNCLTLKTLITDHFMQTKNHVTKIEGVFKAFDQKPLTMQCLGTAGILKEGEKMIADFKDSSAIDAALISNAQKIEHYEIASYGCLTEWAKDLKNTAAAEMLQAMLSEEIAANKSLIELAKSHSNKEALKSKDPSAKACCGNVKQPPTTSAPTATPTPHI